MSAEERMNGLWTEASPQSRPEGVGVAWRARSASRSLPEGREDAPVSFLGTPPPHTHPEDKVQPSEKAAHTPSLHRRWPSAPRFQTRAAPTFLVRGFYRFAFLAARHGS